MERAREEEAAKEALLTASMASNKRQLLTVMAEEEAAREAQVKSLQQLKDREREGLFESLAQGESIYIYRVTHSKGKNLPLT